MKRKAPETNFELMRNLAEAFDATPPEGATEAAEELRACGLVPAGVGKQLAAAAREALKASPMDWRVRAAQERAPELSISSPKELQIEDMAWTRGVLVCYQRLDGAAARLVVRGPRGLITVSTALPSVGPRRFAVAHELGDLEVDRRENSLSLCVAEE